MSICTPLHMAARSSGRPQVIVEDKKLAGLVACILELCKARLRYSLPCRQTVAQHHTLHGSEGKALGRDFIVRLLNSGVKPSISGDLWSDGGMGLFGIYAHGITDMWKMEKALIGLVACESECHTAENISRSGPRRRWKASASLPMSWCSSRSRSSRTDGIGQRQL